jgi:hypothetical protein
MTWKDWIAPGVVMTIVGIAATLVLARISSLDTQYADVSRRLTEIDAKLDRRVDGITSRFDGILQQQTALAGQIGNAQGELAYIRSRLDKVAEKLQVTSADDPVAPQGTPQRPAYGQSPGTSVPTGSGSQNGGGVNRAIQR